MNRYPHISLTLLLSFLLLPPFLLRTFYPNLEPYPAVILPSGADTINVENTRVNFTQTSVWAKEKGQAKSWSKIDSEIFLKPIPIHYLRYIALTSFGLKSKPQKAGSIWKRRYDSILNSKITSDERADTKKWLKQKLIKYGYVPDEFMVVSEEITFDINTGKIVSRTRTDEQIFKLD